MKLTPQQVLQDLQALPPDHKTRDVDALIRRYRKAGADVSALRPHILREQRFHRIYFFVPLLGMADPGERLDFIHENLLFSDWWHTDQLIGFVADGDFERAMAYARGYIRREDPYIRRWGYVLFISRLGRGRAGELLPLIKGDDHETVRMAQAWLAAELAVTEPEAVYAWMAGNGLPYSLNGRAIQKICDSYRITGEWKERFRQLRPSLRETAKKS